jgi:hypothetical protein
MLIFSDFSVFELSLFTYEKLERSRKNLCSHFRCLVKENFLLNKTNYSNGWSEDNSFSPCLATVLRSNECLTRRLSCSANRDYILYGLDTWSDKRHCCSLTRERWDVPFLLRFNDKLNFCNSCNLLTQAD